MKNKLPSSPAVIMNYVMYVVIVLVTFGAAAGIYFAQTKLSEYVTSANHKKVDAEINEYNIAQAKKTEAVLETQKDNIEKAKAIVADTKYYSYQDDIVRDLNTYAKASGVTIVGFNFVAAAGPAAKSAEGGLKTVSADIKLVSPLPYKNYLQFLRYIENNRTKMVVSQVEVEANLPDPALIQAQSITVEIYVR